MNVDVYLTSDATHSSKTIISIRMWFCVCYDCLEPSRKRDWMKYVLSLFDLMIFRRKWFPVLTLVAIIQLHTPWSIWSTWMSTTSWIFIIMMWLGMRWTSYTRRSTIPVPSLSPKRTTRRKNLWSLRRRFIPEESRKDIDVVDLGVMMIAPPSTATTNRLDRRLPIENGRAIRKKKKNRNRDQPVAHRLALDESPLRLWRCWRRWLLNNSVCLLSKDSFLVPSSANDYVSFTEPTMSRRKAPLSSSSPKYSLSTAELINQLHQPSPQKTVWY